MITDKDYLKNVRQRKYIAKDFNSLRAQLLSYAQQYYPDKIKDFSESSLGGLILDLASYVGDVMSFYLDHQFSELYYDTAVENNNIERILRAANVPIVGASSAIVPITFYVQIPAETISNNIVPSTSCIPKILSGTTLSADNGTDFILIENVDFNQKKSNGDYVASIVVGQKTSTGIPLTFIMIATGLCISGKETTENYQIGNDFIPFREIALTYPDVTEILSVTDDIGNVYYQTTSLNDDIVYTNVLNTANDNYLVKDALKIIPAPFRYITKCNLTSRKTSLIFGGGNADSLEDDIIPDPSEFAISLPYTKTFSRVQINPLQLLQTKTHGIAATNTTLSITYRYGGGLDHCVPANTITTIKSLNITFPGNPSYGVAAKVKASVEVSNKIPSSGGEDAPSIDDLKELIPSMKNSQERIVTRQDLLARIYTIPSNFGRVFRASTRSNPNNPLSTQLFVISRNEDNQLITSPDTLKKNLSTYLNPYRLISDAIDILDAKVINIGLSFDALIDPNLNKSIILQNILLKLQSTMNIKNYHIDQPIIISDITNVIYQITGVMSINNVKFNNIYGIVNNRTYSDEVFDIQGNTRKGIIFPPSGAIFECRYPQYDIVGKTMISS